MNLTEQLKKDVETHPVLSNEWLKARKEIISREDLVLWLSQEYFVSVDFVNWFLWTASLTNDVQTKITLVHNIWEELGEGVASASHVSILTEFLIKIGIPPGSFKILKYTKNYLFEMTNLTRSNLYHALGALGPANEYLLRLEYGAMYKAYNALRKEINLPDASFFEVNLEADSSHSEEMFCLIEKVCDTEEKKELVIEGNNKALNARLQFYEGLMTCSSL